MNINTIKVYSLVVGLHLIQSSLFAFYENREIDFAQLAEQELSFMYRFKNSSQNDSAYETYFNQGNEAFNANEIDQAIDFYLKSIQANSEPAQSHFNLGVAYESQGKINEAIGAYKDAILRKPNYPRAHQKLGRIYQQQENIDTAIYHYQQAVLFDKNMVESAICAARLLVDKERFKESVPYFEIAAKERPTDIQIRFEYANTLNTVNETEKALKEYLDLLKIRPNDTGILYNTAYTYKKLGLIDESMPFYEKTLAFKPDHSEAHFSLGLTYLVNGDFKQGWPEYEWRWHRNSQMQPREFKQPMWDGSSLEGKIIFIHAEQGLGDTFQFIRYAQVVKEKYHATTIVAVQKPLLDVIKNCCPYIDRVISLDYIPQYFDYHIPMLSLPFVLKTEQHTIPGTSPYIIPDPALTAEWKEKLSHDTNFKVGICWQGNSNYSTPFLRAVVAAKSLSLHKFAPLGEIPGVTLYSLQRETGTSQVNSAAQQFKLVTFDDSFDNQHGRFMDTAAVMKNLDLIITIDTSTCHLAGAIGVPVWVMIPEPPDWRWMLKRSDSPWYPYNMRLFRQPICGDWESVIETMAQELRNLIKKKQIVDVAPQIAPICESIIADHDYIAAVIQELCNTIIKEKASPDNPSFMNTVRSIYLLDSIRNLKLAV